VALLGHDARSSKEIQTLGIKRQPLGLNMYGKRRNPVLPPNPPSRDDCCHLICEAKPGSSVSQWLYFLVLGLFIHCIRLAINL
jgi:hypothetical protein